MQLRLAWVFVCLMALASPSIGCGATVNFGFSFTNSGSLVRGVILGLEDNATSRAQSVRITSAVFGVGEYVSDFDAPPNSFSVSDGVLTGFSFVSIGRFNDPPAVACCTLALFAGPKTSAALWDSPEPISVIPGLVSDFAVTRLVGRPPAPVPLPTPILMLLAALAGLRCLGRSRPPVRAA